jgi:hypothetical protein
VTDFLETKRNEITDRLKELEPVVHEVRRLEAAGEALLEVIGSAASNAGSTAVAAVTRGRGPGRPPGSGAGKKGAGRPRGSGKGRPKAAQTNTPATGASAVTAAATPAVAVPKKGPGRPKGSGKKVGRPAGSGKKAGRPAGKVGSPTKARRGGRRKGSGTRAAQALSFVQGQPGITVPELAAKMGIKQNYLYRVLPGLEQEGKLEKKGRGWHPKSA